MPRRNGRTDQTALNPLSAALVEELGIFPTLLVDLEVAGLPPPPQRLHGASLLLLLLHDLGRGSCTRPTRPSPNTRRTLLHGGMTMRTAECQGGLAPAGGVVLEEVECTVGGTLSI